MHLKCPGTISKGDLLWFLEVDLIRLRCFGAIQFEQRHRRVTVRPRQPNMKCTLSKGKLVRWRLGRAAVLDRSWRWTSVTREVEILSNGNTGRARLWFRVGRLTSRASFCHFKFYRGQSQSVFGWGPSWAEMYISVVLIQSYKKNTRLQSLYPHSHMWLGELRELFNESLKWRLTTRLPSPQNCKAASHRTCPSPPLFVFPKNLWSQSSNCLDDNLGVTSESQSPQACHFMSFTGANGTKCQKSRHQTCTSVHPSYAI